MPVRLWAQASPFHVQACILELTENVKMCEEKNKELRGKLKGTEKKVRLHLGCPDVWVFSLVIQEQLSFGHHYTDKGTPSLAQVD